VILDISKRVCELQESTTVPEFAPFWIDWLRVLRLQDLRLQDSGV